MRQSGPRTRGPHPSDGEIDMPNQYEVLRRACGLSQEQAANFHATRLDTIKSWSSGRRAAPESAARELQWLLHDIDVAATDLAENIRKTAPVIIDDGPEAWRIGTPRDDSDAIDCGWPAAGACLVAVALAVSRLPGDWRITLVERIRGTVPTAVRRRPVPKVPSTKTPASGGFQRQVTSGPRPPDRRR